MSSLLKTILLIFEEIYHFVFPLSEDERLIKDLSTNQFLTKLSIKNISGCVTLANFNDPDVRAVIHLTKFHRQTKSIELLGALLEAYISARIPSPATIISVPLSSKRHRERGYNQVELVAQAACQNLEGFDTDIHILVRKRDTKPQSTLPRKQRLKNMHKAFGVSSNTTSLHNTHIILLDDVMTTGATLKAARAALGECNPKSITCVAIAH